VVCHGSGKISDHLTSKYGSPFAIETATIKDIKLAPLLFSAFIFTPLELIKAHTCKVTWINDVRSPGSSIADNDDIH